MLLLWMGLFSLIFSGCGYHIEGWETPSAISTLSIPYFKGDHEGLLTNAVIKAIGQSNALCYQTHGGEFYLDGKVVSDSTENIGYQWDLDPTTGKRIHRLIPNEGRREVVIELSVVKKSSGVTVYGPYTISAASDYDFIDSDSLQDASFINSNGLRESALFFSLGQLDSMDGAEDSCLDPLYKKIAVKIAEGLSNGDWSKEKEAYAKKL